VRAKNSVRLSRERKLAPMSRRRFGPRRRRDEPHGAIYQPQRPEIQLEVLRSLAVDGPATSAGLTWRLGHGPKMRKVAEAASCLLEEGLVTATKPRPRLFSVTEAGLLVVGL
jgi:hypothetical protein